MSRKRDHHFGRVAGRLLHLAGVLALAACSKPNASGAYLYKADREVAFVQLAPGHGGAVKGRLEDNSIGADGVVNVQSVDLDGAGSGHDPALTLPGAWSHTVQVNGHGFSLKARQSSLQDYQAALSQLKLRAAADQRRIANGQADQAATAAQAAAIGGAGDKVAALQAVATSLREDSNALDRRVDDAPDFAQQAADDTAKIAKIAREASALSVRDRAQSINAATQVVLGANQIDVARAQYAIGLNQIVQRAAPVAADALHFCRSPAAAPLSRSCVSAMAAATQFQGSLVRAATRFKGYKIAVRGELSRQNDIVQNLGG